MVQNIKRELLKRYPKGIVETNIVLKHLVFRKKNGSEIAIEVETGKSFRKHKSRLREKFKDFRVNNHGKIIVVLTNALYRERYKALLQDEYPIFLRSELEELFSAQLKK